MKHAYHLTHPFALSGAILLMMTLAVVVSRHYRTDRPVAAPVPSAVPAPAAWHDPQNVRPSRRILYLPPPAVQPLVVIGPLEPDVTELDPDVADAMAQGAKLVADFDTAKFDVISAHVKDPAKAQAILESNLHTRDVAQAFAGAPDWLRHVAIEQAVAEGAARQDEILADPVVADQMIQALTDRLQAP